MNKDIKRLDLNTPDGAQLNMDALYQIAPSVFTESCDEKTGELKRVVNFDALRQLLGDNAVDENRETYEFRWVGKDAAKAEAARAIDKTLRPVVEDSVDWDTTKNLYIEGDNLEVLKLLQRSYMGKVKMIYIDPPYNTGNDFVYHDDFDRSKYEEELASGAVDELGLRYLKSSENDGKFHSNWCSMIYSRLMVAKSLLSEDGVIFISIDDNEQEHLKNICDEIFGEANFIASIVRNTNSTKNQTLFVSVSHEYCLVYSKNIDTLKIKHSENKWSVPKNNTEEYIKKVKQLQKEGLSSEEITEELKTLTKYPRFIDFTNYWYFDERGLYRKGDLGGVKNGNMIPLNNPLTGKDDPVPPGGYRYNSEKLNALAKDNRIHFHTDGSLPTIKRYLHENEEQRPKSIMSDDQRPDYKMLQDFGLPFDNPKQLSFMKRICYIVDKDALILDFFSGSATTAHAVMQLNAEDGGNRKFIMVQLPEETAEDSEAYKDGFKNICEIGEERIKRAGEKIKEEHPEVADTLDTGFRVFRLDDSNFNPGVKASPSEYNQQQLDLFANNIKSDRNDLDLLFGSILAWGLQLDLPMETEEVDGCKIYTVNEGDLVACFAEKVTDKVIEAMAEKEPLRVLFRDSCFDSDDKKINIFETFKQKLDWTDDEAFNNIRVI